MVETCTAGFHPARSHPRPSVEGLVAIPELSMKQKSFLEWNFIFIAHSRWKKKRLQYFYSCLTRKTENNQYKDRISLHCSQHSVQLKYWAGWRCSTWGRPRQSATTEGFPAWPCWFYCMRIYISMIYMSWIYISWLYLRNFTWDEVTYVPCPVMSCCKQQR